MRDADFLRSYRAVVDSYRLGAASAERVLRAVLRRIRVPSEPDETAPGTAAGTGRRIGT